MFDRVRKHIQRLRRRQQKTSLPVLFARFQDILKLNNQILELMADMNDKSGGDYVFDSQYIRNSCQAMTELVRTLINNFNILVDERYHEIGRPFARITSEIEAELEGRRVIPDTPFILSDKDITVASAEVVGGKNANLAELKNQLSLPVPVGFAITISAFHAVLDANDLPGKISAITAGWANDDIPTPEASRQIQELILSAKIPPDVSKTIRDAVSIAQKKAGSSDFLWAVRSSALGEDSEHSYAGQFMTRLNIPSEDIADTYRRIMSSTYSAPAMTYRQEKGINDNEVAMAVACQQIVSAHKSGVLFTLDPVAPETEIMVLSATWGLGAPIVSGKVHADRYSVSRTSAHTIIAEDVVPKTKQLLPLPKGDCTFEDVPEDRQTRPCLDEEEIRRIAEIGMKIEKYFRKPQEVEWAMDQNGKLFILQARPLNIRAKLEKMVCDISAILNEHPILFSQQGVIAQNGIASGTVFVVKNDEDLYRFPAGAILVAKQSSPKFAAVAGKANGIITDIGSPTGHMATIAREFRVPTILDTGVATRLLSTGQDITMDAEENVVYSGILKELCLYDFVGHPFEESYEYRLLRRVLKKISPLFLLDPKDKNFAPLACRTYHDITRFIHEKAVDRLLHINQYPAWGQSDAPAVRLKSDIPMDLMIIDIGGGIADRKGTKPVAKEQIQSMPMRALLSGMQSAGAWDTDPMAVDFKGFMSSLTRTFSPELANPKYIGQNLAVISREYINVNLRLGYHFNLIDAYVSDQVNDNYAYFRFLGGVTDQTRRNRRAKLIAMILEQYDFIVRLRLDLVIARIKKLNPAMMAKKIKILGQVVAFARQLDVQMINDSRIEAYFNKFNTLISGSPPNEPAPPADPYTMRTGTIP